MYANGLRASELTNLKYSDINFNSKSVRVYGKGSKERIVPIHQNALLLLKKYWIQEIEKHNSTVKSKGKIFIREYLFVNKNNLKLTRKGLWYLQEMLGHSSISTTQIYTHLSDKFVKNEYDKFSPRVNL